MTTVCRARSVRVSNKLSSARAVKEHRMTVWIIFREGTIMKVFVDEYSARLEQAIMLTKGIYSTSLIAKSID